MSINLSVSLVFGVTLDPPPRHLQSRLEGDRHVACECVGDTSAAVVYARESRVALATGRYTVERPIFNVSSQIAGVHPSSLCAWEGHVRGALERAGTPLAPLRRLSWFVVSDPS